MGQVGFGQKRRIPAKTMDGLCEGNHCRYKCFRRGRSVPRFSGQIGQFLFKPMRYPGTQFLAIGAEKVYFGGSIFLAGIVRFGPYFRPLRSPRSSPAVEGMPECERFH